MTHLATVKSFVDYKNLTDGPLSKLRPDLSLKNRDWHVLAEGDSWFSFSSKNLNCNLLTVLEFNKSTAICNLSCPGDNVDQMMNDSKKGLFNSRRVKIFKRAVKHRKWDLFLLSAGGNDLIDAFDGGYEVSQKIKLKIIKSDKNGNDYLDYLDLNALQLALEHIKSCYQAMIDIFRSSKANKNTKIISHTYDYFTIRNIKDKKDKSSRQKALEGHGVPRIYWKQIVTHMNQALSDALFSFNDPAKNIYIVRTIDTLVPADEQEPGNTKHWRNEIHPNEDGYIKLGHDKINAYLVH